MTKKIGLFGGSFDPIHHGHLNLALELMEKKQLDEVWWIPTQLNPFKLHLPSNLFSHRLAMVELAIQPIPQFKIKDIEKNRPAPSYTIDTLRFLVDEDTQLNQAHEYYLLMGEDTVKGLMNWKQPEEIIQLTSLLIGSRFSVEKIEEFIFSEKIKQAIWQGWVPTPLMDISSTEIRRRINQKQYCSHLIPSLVLDYIQKNDLYSETVFELK